MSWPHTESSKLTLLSVLCALVVVLFYICPLKGLHEGSFYLLLAAVALLPPNNRNFWRSEISAQFHHQPLLWMVLLYIIYQWVSLGWSDVASASEWGEAIRKGSFSFLWMLMIALTAASAKRDKLLLPLWVIAAAVSAGMALPDYSAYGTDNRLTGFGRSENAVQAGCLFGSALLVAFYLLWKNRSDRAVAAIYGLFWIVIFLALLATQSRGALLATLLGHGIFLLPWWKRLWPIAVVMLIAIFSLGDWQGWLARADGFRLEIWQHVLEEWRSQPIFGLGFRTPFEQTLSNGQTIFQPHSLYITALYYGGVIGLALLLALWALAFKQAFQYRAHSLLPLTLLVYGFTVALFDFDLLLVNVRTEWILFWLPWGMALGLTINQQRKAKDEDPS